MNYKLKNLLWDGAFAVPNGIVEKYLKTATGVQFKVLVCIFKDSEAVSAEKLTRECGIGPAECQSALNYWIEKGVIKETEETDENRGVVISKIAQVSKPAKKATYYERPDSVYIANRVTECKDIAVLMREAEEILGRPLSNGDRATLVTLHDHDGLPVDVILMLLQYAAGVGKTNMKYIEKIGINWSESGITTLEIAEEKIKGMSGFAKVWKNFESIAGISHRTPTAKEEEAVWRWFNGWGFGEDIVREAYERCVNKNGKYVLGYMDGILKRWKAQNYTDLTQILAENSTRKKAQLPQNSDTEKYDIFEEMTWDEINGMISGNFKHG